MRENIWHNRFTQAIGWGVATRIQTGNTGDALAPQVAAHPASGNFVSVWSQSDGGLSLSSIWGNVYR